MTRIRDIAKILGRSEAPNTNNRQYITDAPFDSAKVTNIIRTESSPIAKYDSIGALPTTGLTNGDRALVENSDSNSARFYISNGSGWYNAELVNISPSISLSPSGTITLSDAGATSTVTVTSSDSDNPDAIISYSFESDGNMHGTGTIVTQDSSVFTIDPLTSGSGGVAGDFTLTFKASDGIGFTTATKDFSLQFIGTVTVSNAGNKLSFVFTSTATANKMVTALNNCITSNNTYGLSVFTFYNGATNKFTGMAQKNQGDGVDYTEAGGPAYRSGTTVFLGTATGTRVVKTGGDTNVGVAFEPTSVTLTQYIVSNGQQNTTLSTSF